MPNTWVELRARYGLGADPYDPHDNILAGAAYIRELHDGYGSPSFLAAYNAEPRRYEHHLATDRPLADETQAYVATLASIIESKQTGGKIVAIVKVVALDPIIVVCRARREQLVRRSAAARRASRSSTEDRVSPSRCGSRCRSAIAPPITTRFCCRSIGAAAAVRQPIRTPCPRGSIAMIQIALHRGVSGNIAYCDVRQGEQGQTSHGRPRMALLIGLRETGVRGQTNGGEI
jgi:transglycosylase-like protein with SLT domain